MCFFFLKILTLWFNQWAESVGSYLPVSHSSSKHISHPSSFRSVHVAFLTIFQHKECVAFSHVQTYLTQHITLRSAYKL